MIIKEVIKKPFCIVLFLFFNVLFLFLLFKYVLRDFFLSPIFYNQLFVIAMSSLLIFLISLNLTCNIFILRNKIKSNKKISVSGTVFSIFLLPFLQSCVVGACGGTLIITLSALLPVVIIRFFTKYFVLLLFLAIALEIYSLKKLNCFKDKRNNFNKFKIKTRF